MGLGTLQLIPEGTWVRVVGTHSRPFTDLIKYSILPISYRKYDVATKNWLVHFSKLDFIVSAARRFYDYVDWSSLPVDWQLVAAGAQMPSELTIDNSYENPFSVLFVTDDAPIEVVKASYKVLAHKYHPDHGGDHDRMTKLNQAYDEILKHLK